MHSSDRQSLSVQKKDISKGTSFTRSRRGPRGRWPIYKRVASIQYRRRKESAGSGAAAEEADARRHRGIGGEVMSICDKTSNRTTPKILFTIYLVSF